MDITVNLTRGDRLVTTAGVAQREDRFFLARRAAGGAQSERWEFPGGKCDQNDRDERICLIREFQEEFGATVEVHDELGTIDFQHGERHYILVAYRISFVTEPDTLFVHTEAGWFTIPQLLELDLADSDRHFVERILIATR